ncbi:hypothetical protein OE699_02045 [Sedimentimonas flavescens]|uniref:Concanavalin A-like lectin/glucanase superfamily protein n=1 Tax=Sedimentimonas flavescens TaxID=2851012 RepID=A0ABT2ZV42_9RHOB|nr:hypothetical protein [Sedimentimonas flavescens]MCV2877621.1 hypothetical protein [Sedimentimonas flavescens]
MGILNYCSWGADALDYAVPGTIQTSASYVGADGFALIQGPARIPTNSLSTDIWACSKTYFSAVGFRSEQPLRFFAQDGTTTIAYLASSTAETFTLWVNIGGTLTNVGTSAVQALGTNSRIDAHLVIGVSGSVEVFANGTSILSWSGDNSNGGAYTSCESVEFDGYASNAAGNPLWCLIADEDTRVFDCQQIIPTGAGAHTDFGAYTSVDDFAADPYTDFASSTTVGDKLSAACTDPLARFSTGYDVVGVAVTARARAGNGSPRLKPLIRHGGVDATGDAALLNGTDSATKHLFTVNPSTGLPWTYAELASMEIGCEVAAPA